MACAKLAKEMADKLGTPTVISKNLAVYRSLWKALDHSGDNPTGLNCKLRIALYDRIAADTVNIDGRYFERIWAYLMKPKYVISGTAYGQNTMGEDKPTIGQRILGVFTGKKAEPPGGKQNGS